mgnify:CR=1 FL=1
MKIRSHHHYPSRRSPTVARNMVAASQPLAVQSGLRSLNNGGNAIDAAIATAITLTLVEPTGCGLGSDSFAIVWDGAELHGLNSSGRSPAGWTYSRFEKMGKIPFRGWDSITVPGVVRSWVELSERFGNLPFEKLFEDAINYANIGFPVSPVIAQLWERGALELKDQPGFAQNFLKGGGPPRAGEIYSNRAMAKTLQLIAETNGRAFYQGALAESIEENSILNGACLRLSDLADFQPDWCGTIGTKFDNFTLHEIPPNGQGIAALIALGILNNTCIRDLDADDPLAIHLQIEAMKLALRDAEEYVADPDYMNEIKSSDLLSAEYHFERSKLIDLSQATDFKASAPRVGGTVYLSTADQNGMMVSYIQSNYAGFGSGVCIPETGIHFQNRGAGFSMKKNTPNVVGPAKRPFHTIIPAFLMDAKKPLMSFGVMGGPMQAQGHLQMALRTQLWKQDPQMAIDAPRWRVTSGVEVACETTMNHNILTKLRDFGHQVVLETPDNSFGFGGAQLIAKLNNGVYLGGSESRKDGYVGGF